MKKIILLSLIVFSQFSPTKAQWVTIPDTNFVTKLQQLYPNCMNGNQMDTTCSQIVSATLLTVYNSNVQDLTGVEYFDNLTALTCSSNPLLNSLSALPNTLQYLNCSLNELTSLPLLPNSLQYLDCNNNNLTYLPALPNSLEHLDCYYNQIIVLPTLPDSLQHLDCSQNPIIYSFSVPNSLKYLNCQGITLTSLPALPNTLKELLCTVPILPQLPTDLEKLWCNGDMTSLPPLPQSLLELYCHRSCICGPPFLDSLPQLPSSLQILSCGSRGLNSLPQLPNSLQSLNCGNNQITVLPTLPASLQQLYCGNNQITSLPSLPSSLQRLTCSYNQLTSLPPLPSSLQRLTCSSNQITNLPPVPNVMYECYIQNNNISCLFNLPQVNGATYANISSNPLTCVPNQTNYSLGLPLCLDGDTVNNTNNCISTVNIAGYVFTDNFGNNCIYNSYDMGSANIPVKLYDSLNTLVALSNTSGGTYGFMVNQVGPYKVKIGNNNLPFTMACAQPDSQTVNLVSLTNGIYTANFPVQCIQAFDVNVQSVNAHGFVFPGQTHTLHTNVSNNENWFNLNCTTATYSGVVTIDVAGPVTYIATASGALTPIVSGNTFTYAVSDFNSLTPTSFGLMLMTDTSAQAGDQICVHVEVNPTPLDADTSNNVYDFCYQVVNSYDPNMKEVYPVNVLPSYDDWFTYTIHFQNTGNAPAFNIRLRDTLDANLDINSFEVRGYSHPTNISLNGNILTVRFNNIMLPDSTSDYEGSMGYFQYRLKPLPNLPNGTQIENTAYIYFDYNAPIVTNTTQNNFDMTVKTNNILAEAQRYVLYPNPSTGLFMFNDNKNIKSVEVFNIMGELVLSQGSAKLINLQAFPKGIYIARINGEFVSKLVKE